MDRPIQVTNRSNGFVAYTLPERHLRREFHPHETKTVEYQELLEISAQSGGRELLYNYLLIKDPAAMREILNVNEEWLRTGNGEMFIPKSKEQLFSELLGEAVKADENDFKRRLFLALSKLDDSGWENLEKLIDSIAKKEE